MPCAPLQRASGALDSRVSSCATSPATRRPPGMLKERILTAIVLVVVLLGVMLGLPPVATVWLLTVLVLIGAWEWAGFIGKGGAPLRIAFTTAVALCLVAGLYFYGATPGFVPVVMAVAVAWWFVAFLWICLAPARVNPVTAALAGLLSL